MYETTKMEEWQNYLLGLLKGIAKIASQPDRRPFIVVSYQDHLKCINKTFSEIMDRIERGVELIATGHLLYECEKFLIIWSGGRYNVSRMVLKNCIVYQHRLDTVEEMENLGFIIYSFIQLLQGRFDTLLEQINESEIDG